MVFLTLLIIPVLIAFGMLVFANKRITLMEFGVQVVAQMAFAGICMAVIYNANVADQEVLNGQVTGKTRERVSCRHSYPCHCHEVCSGSGKNRSCWEHCDTCYSHNFDIDWNVQTNMNHTFGIDTIDRQGLREPPRWTVVRTGEPVAFSHGFDNYIKASPDTLFRHQGLIEKYKDRLPAYPLTIYDYWHLDRVLLVNGASLPDLKAWNESLSDMNGRLGPTKQTNVVMVVTKSMPDDYFYALEQRWLGGKKNDVVVVIDTPDNQMIDWVGVMSWTDRAILKVKLRDAIHDIGTFDRTKVFPVIEQNVSELFVRKSMKDFKYLTGQIVPTPAEYGWSIALGILLALGLSYWFYTQDPFEDIEREYGIGNKR